MSLIESLYPEWDEFYLLVCDICGIIIRPQALKKHLATKHRINVQQTAPNHNQSLQINNKISNNLNKNNINGHKSKTATDNAKPQNGTIAVQKQQNQPQTLQQHHHQQHQQHQQHPTPTPTPPPQPQPQPQPQQQQPFSKRLWGGKHALDSVPQPAIKRRPCDWEKVRQSSSTSSKYLDRKWRNTYKVLKDAFL